MMPRRAIAAIALAVLAQFCATALELKEGLVRLVINESTARISIYRLVDIAKGRYESLIFDQDPRTSFATLSIDGRFAKLGDASDYRVSVSRTDTGAQIEFRSSFCAVRQYLDFAKSEGAALADGIKVRFELENVSERDSMLGLRYLIDTNLAEKSGIHFSSSTRSRINEETSILPNAADTWIATPGDKASFMVQFGGPGVDRPDRVILANWKRLSDAPWGFEANIQRNFTLVPYSINDSAMDLFWEPGSVPRGGIRKISFFMGSLNEKGYPAAVAGKTQTEDIFASTVLSAGTPDIQASIATDLVAVRDLISRIDRSISTGAKISDEELAAWKRILDRLEERKKVY